MAATIALLGDVMLGRKVAERLALLDPADLVSAEVRELTTAADLVVANLECCVSERGERWPEPGKPFFFRAPPAALGTLTALGMDCVTLANNHALDYGEAALLDTLEHLAGAGIRVVGAGADQAQAREPVVLPAGELRIGIQGVTDHPADFAAGPDSPGVAYADLRRGVPSWLTQGIRALRDRAEVVLVTPHWGPNMTPEPVRHVRATAAALVEGGATLIAGHSAHVFQGVAGRVLYDLGDFIDDYRVDPVLRNDLGLLFFVELEADGPRSVAALPLKLEYCHTRLARGADADWIARRFDRACAALGTEVERRNGRLIAALTA